MNTDAIIANVVMTMALYRRCDSKNLNLSPLCDLAAAGAGEGPSLFTEEVVTTYQAALSSGDLPSYIKVTS